MLFTPRANHVTLRAQQESTLLWHRNVGSEHLLIALAQVRDGAVAATLFRQGLDAVTIRKALEQRGGAVRLADGIVSLTPRMITLLLMAERDAVGRGDTRVDAEHLLAVLLQEGRGTGVALLSDVGADPHGLLATLRSARAG